MIWTFLLCNIFFALDVMLNEPEYEDEPVGITTSLSNSEDTSSAVEHNRVVRKAEQIHNQITRNSYESLSTHISQSQLVDMVHSTPIRYFIFMLFVCHVN